MTARHPLDGLLLCAAFSLMQGSVPALSGRFEVGHAITGVAAVIDASAPAGDLFNGFVCGAVVVGRTELLTAAHCVVDREASGTNVVIGADNLCRDGALSGRRVQVIDVEIHPRYALASGRFDLASLRVSEAVAASSIRDVGSSEDHDLAVALGWGSATYGGPPACRLTLTHLVLPDQASCGSHIGEGSRVFDPASMLCATPLVPGSDTCTGDSGGPLIAGDASSGVVIGLVSWGNGCASGLAGVYARADVSRPPTLTAGKRQP